LEARLKTFNNSSYSEEQWRQKLWAEGKALALICEEVTTYGDFINNEELLSKFGKLALTKSRKQEMPLTVVAHNNTQTCLFGIRGLYKLVAKMLQVECLAQVDQTTLQPKSTGKAKVKLDSSNQWIDVDLPKMTAKISDFGDTPSVAPSAPSIAPPNIDRARLERIYELEFQLDKPEATPAKPQLSEMARHLLEWLQQKREATANDVQITYKIAKHIKPNTVAKILELFKELHSCELAEYDGDRKIKLL
jgi:hypothetical protein